jgi:hypothetical protein
MNDERFRQVDRVLQSVPERPVEEREAYLDKACAGDEQLREQVESMLASYEREAFWKSLLSSLRAPSRPTRMD